MKGIQGNVRNERWCEAEKRRVGFRLGERWFDWSGAPFTASSSGHISLYRRAPG